MGEKSAPRREKGNSSGRRISWKMLGKKARIKMARKRRVFRRLVSNGIEIVQDSMSCDVKFDVSSSPKSNFNAVKIADFYHDLRSDD